MSEIIAFTDNIRDLSNENGYQFEFVCERCGNGYRSAYRNNVAERGRGLLRGAGSLLGGRFEQFSYATQQLSYDRGTNSKAKDAAMAQAVDAVRDQFRQCRGCGEWVCDLVCWNNEIGQCLVCSPSIADEISRAQAAAQVEQVQEKVRQTDWTADLNLTTRARVACPHCHAKVDGGKFCPECGGKLASGTFCSECGTSLAEAAKFCPECGSRAAP